MARTHLWRWTTLLVVFGYAQDAFCQYSNSTNATMTSRSPTDTSSREFQSQITNRPVREGRVPISGDHMVFYNNATFATSCAYSDSDCMKSCTWQHEACSRTLAAWSRTGLKWSTNTAVFERETVTGHDGTQSLTVIDGYTYAMGPWTPTRTWSRVLTRNDPQREIISTIVPMPLCATPTFECSKQSWCNTNACTVQGGTVELLFWPSTSNTRSMNDSTAGPVTAIYKNTTLTSPSVYLEYKTAYAVNGCSQKVGGSYPGAILALDPGDLYSMNAKNDYFIMTTTINHRELTTSFYEKHKVNYDDLTGLPPGSAYQEMPICIASGCGIITPSLFHPQLVVPTHIREMDPAWSTCDLDWRGSWDPPIALSSAKSIAGPTTPSEPIRTEPASPKSTIDGPAKATASPNNAEPSSVPVPSPNPGNDPAEATTLPGEEEPHSQIISSNEPIDLSQDVRTSNPVFTYAPISTSGQPISASTNPIQDPGTSLPPVIEATDLPRPDPLPTTVSYDPASSTSHSYQPAPSNDQSTVPHASKLPENTDLDTDTTPNSGPAPRISYQPLPDRPTNAYEVLSAALQSATASQPLPKTELTEKTTSCAPSSVPERPTTAQSPASSSAFGSSSSLLHSISEMFLPSVTEGGEATISTTTAASRSSLGDGDGDGGSILPSVTDGDGTISLPSVINGGASGVTTQTSPLASSSPSPSRGGSEEDAGDESSAATSGAKRTRDIFGAWLWLVVIAGACVI